MALPDAPDFDDDKWPFDVRKALRWCVGMLERDTEISYQETQSPKWDQASDKEVITLPLNTKGGTSSLQPFTLINASTVANPGRFRVKSSTIVDELPTGFSAGDSPPFYLTAPAGSGFVYAKVTDDDDYVVTDRDIVVVGTVYTSGDDEEHVGYELIGTTNYTVADMDNPAGILIVNNDRYGPVFHINCGGSDHYWG